MEKKNMKQPNCKTNLLAHASSLLYSINRKTLMERYDSMHERMETALKAKGGPMEY